MCITMSGHIGCRFFDSNGEGAKEDQEPEVRMGRNNEYVMPM